MANRPKIKIELTLSDKAIELACWLIVLQLWVLAAYNYSTLPAAIPTHFNGTGQIDGYGGKNTIFLLPAIGTVLFAVFTYLNKIPDTFNYLVEITNENAEAQYRIATRLLRFVKIGCLITFLLIEYAVVQSAAGKSAGLGVWFLPVTLAFTFIPVLYFAVSSWRRK